ncbi:MAG: N-acetylneuraminate synthase family protein [Chloroflexi bacterium]|nr:N-acetylneuraminate synthase family protein [Chloroflexota bacterium]
MSQIKLGNRLVGDGQPAFVIAEMAWSHDGSAEKARTIIKATAGAGADAVSVHLTSLKDYMVKDYGSTAGKTTSGEEKKESIYEYMERANLRPGDWQEIFPYARSLGLAVCAMPNDIPSLRLCEQLGADAYVVAAACFVQQDLVSEVARTKRPVILRIGGATLGEIENTVSLIRQLGTSDIILLHGIQLYPTRIEDTHLRLIPTLKATFGLPVGLADHVDADSDQALALPLVALGFGASAIEKHLTHDRSLKGEDFESALNPDEFKKLVAQIREVEKSFGSSSFRPLSSGEQRYRQVSRKRTVAARLIRKGTRITAEDIAFKRADDGVYPDESKFIPGRTAAVDIKEDVPITWDKLL